jgi:hypothetical protein
MNSNKPPIEGRIIFIKDYFVAGVKKQHTAFRKLDVPVLK